MNDLTLSAFRHAIKAIHGTRSRFVESIHVIEAFRGDPLWQGEVLVFELLDHPRAPRCYAWEMQGEITAILQDHVVDSPQEAVRAAILGW